MNTPPPPRPRAVKMLAGEVADLRALLGEGFHAGFRKGSDHPLTSIIWKAIRDLPDQEYGHVLDFLMLGIRPHLEQDLLPAVLKRQRRTP